MRTRLFSIGASAWIYLCAALIFPADGLAQRGTGLLPEDPVPFEVFRDMPKYRDYLPARADLSDFFPQAGNQGSQGSCTAWATAYGLRSFFANVMSQKIRATALSPSFVYNQLKTDPQDCTEPLRISDALKFLQKRGTVPIDDFPYREASCTERPSQAIQTVAGEFRIDDWRRINHLRLDDIKGELAQGSPVVIGMGATSRFENLPAGTVYGDVVSGERALTHAVVLVGYDEEKAAFRAFNSWGTDWGDNGYGWISYRSLAADLDSAFVAAVGDYSLDTLIAARRAVAVSSETPEQTADRVETAVAPPKEPGTWKLDLANFANRLECANLSMSIEGGKLASLGGYVSTERDMFALVDLLADHAETGDANVSVNIRPWPQCEALTTFARTFSRPQGLTVAAVNEEGGRTGALADGELMGIRIRTPDFPSYLYVTYLQSGGDAVHLIGRQGEGKRYAPNTDVTFGLDPAQPRFRIGPPYGREMIIAVASHVPLFERGYDILEEERTYLTRFRQRMLDIGSKKITGHFAARAAYIETSAREN